MRDSRKPFRESGPTPQPLEKMSLSLGVMTQWNPRLREPFKEPRPFRVVVLRLFVPELDTPEILDAFTAKALLDMASERGSPNLA